MPFSPLVLASGSPRRRELLAALGLTFSMRPADVDESLRPGETPFEAAERLARDKAAAVAAVVSPDAVVVAADTIVVLCGRALGKPADRADAGRMLRALRGQRHEVVTGVALARAGRIVSGRSVTEVVFGPMTDEDVNCYLASGEADDKAGAYALQGRAALFIETITGSPSNVIGLPVRLFGRLAAEIGFPMPER
jgi:septum formation protein